MLTMTRLGGANDRPQSREECEERICRALATGRASPSRGGPAGIRSNMPRYVHDAADMRAQAETKRDSASLPRYVPTARDQGDYDTAMRWFLAIDPEHVDMRGDKAAAAKLMAERRHAGSAVGEDGWTFDQRVVAERSRWVEVGSIERAPSWHSIARTLRSTQPTVQRAYARAIERAWKASRREPESSAGIPAGSRGKSPR